MIASSLTSPLTPFVDDLPLPPQLLAREHDGHLSVRIRMGRGADSSWDDVVGCEEATNGAIAEFEEFMPDGGRVGLFRPAPPCSTGYAPYRAGNMRRTIRDVLDRAGEVFWLHKSLPSF